MLPKAHGLDRIMGKQQSPPDTHLQITCCEPQSVRVVKVTQAEE